jgi:predicted AAA+ superfamily ATPase
LHCVWSDSCSLQQMHRRSFWETQIEQAWAEKSIVWLAGVRRSGKTTLCRGLSNVEYFDCELPSVRSWLEDPESFLEEQQGKRLVIDEVHRLENPSELLKIAADHYPSVQIVATGSSTLGASRKFRDTLTGRKRSLLLTPMIAVDEIAFEHVDPKHRMLRGGLPPYFLARRYPAKEYSEWFDGYWAKDLQELFRLERRSAFQKMLELLFRQSGGLFEAASFASPCGISRPTVQTYLDILAETLVVHVLRPFHNGQSREITHAPKVYAFDTGFVCNFRSWNPLRDDDLGPLWEHLVLNELVAQLQGRTINYWRDKERREIDFVVAGDPTAPTAIEAKWSVDAFNVKNLKAFRALHPQGKNLLVCQNVDRARTKRFGDIVVRCVHLKHLRELSV